MAGNTKYWYSGLPLDGLNGSTAGGTKYWFNGVPYDTLAAAVATGVSATASLTQASDSASAATAVAIKASSSVTEASDSASAAAAVVVRGLSSAAQDADGVASSGTVLAQADVAGTQGSDAASASGAVAIAASLSSTAAGDEVAAIGTVLVTAAASIVQAGDILAAFGVVVAGASASVTQDSQLVVATGGSGAYPVANVVQDGQAISAAATVPAKGTLNATQANNVAPPPEIFVAAPSYGTWVKRQNKNKPKAPQFPPPVEAGEIVIDEAVLRQMEEERLAALVLQRKTEALGRVDELRSFAPAERRPARSVTLDRERFDVVETALEVRTRVISLFREQPKPTLVEPVRGSITLRALGPRHLPEPEIRKARTISLRRAPHRTMQTGL